MALKSSVSLSLSVLGTAGNSIGSVATTSEHHRQFKGLSSAGSGLIKVETAQHAGWPPAIP